MTDTAEVVRPVPRWVLALAVVACAVAVVLLILGQLVTTLKAGMADPLWPTEPWYLLKNYKEEVGYLVEHSHRIVGFAFGGVVSVVVLACWWREPRKRAWWCGVLGMVVLLAGYGELHRAAMNQPDPNRFDTPVVPLAVIGVALLVLAATGIFGLAAGTRGSGLRLFGTVALVAVMAQGLLGGLRVKLNALHGPELAAIHGVFAQIVFSLVVLLALFCSKPSRTELSRSAFGPVGWLSLVLFIVLLGQLVLGVLVRHLPTPLAQRLHMLTAFLVVAVAVWLLRVGFTNTQVRPRIATAGWLLGLLLAVQLVLGVEAWMGKFSEEAWAGQQAGTYLPESAIPPPLQVAIRTSHVLVGTGILASAVVLAVGLRRRTGETVASQVEHDSRAIATPRPELVAASTDAGESA
jgi:heme A synthase